MIRLRYKLLPNLFNNDGGGSCSMFCDSIKKEEGIATRITTTKQAKIHAQCHHTALRQVSLGFAGFLASLFAVSIRSGRWRVERSKFDFFLGQTNNWLLHLKNEMCCNVFIVLVNYLFHSTNSSKVSG